MLRRHRQSVVRQREHVSVDGFADIPDGGFARVALRDAAWKARAFGNPEPVLAGIEEDLSHVQKIPPTPVRGVSDHFGTPSTGTRPKRP